MPNINLVAVIIAAIVAIIVGGLWYSPILFAKQWMKFSGISQKHIDVQKKDMLKYYGAAFIGALITAYVLAIFVQFAAAGTVLTGAVVGFWAWLGFVATTSLSQVIWEKRNTNLYVINNGQVLVSFVVMGAILAMLP